MNIRTATIADIPVIHRLAHEIWWPTYRDVLSEAQISFMLNNMYSEDALRRQMDEGMEFRLAERESIAVAFAAYSLTESNDMVYKLHKLYVLPSEQGKGTGRQLIENISDTSREKGGKILELNVNRGNPAYQFYKKLGFETYQTVDIPYFGFVLNDYVMRKPL